MITLTLIANYVGIAKLGLEKLGHAHSQCLHLNMKIMRLVDKMYTLDDEGTSFCIIKSKGVT